MTDRAPWAGPDPAPAIAAARQVRGFALSWTDPVARAHALLDLAVLTQRLPDRTFALDTVRLAHEQIDLLAASRAGNRPSRPS